MPSSPLDMRHAISLIVLVLAMPVVACGPAVLKYIVLHVVKYSNLDRVITNIIFNDTDLGVMNRYGSAGAIVYAGIAFSVQTSQWTLGGPRGTPRNGEILTARNQLIISQEQIPTGAHCLGIHVYPDDTVEFAFANGFS